jgi:hypothetical protein
VAVKNIRECDRCGRECKDSHGRTQFHEIVVDDKNYDLCPKCYSPLRLWLQRDNTTRPGDSLEWEEVCIHQVPCAGPCHSGQYRRRR